MKGINYKLSNNEPETVIRYTPRQLINLHIKFPEQPITSLHIQNLVTGGSAEFDKQENRFPFFTNN